MRTPATEDYYEYEYDLRWRLLEEGWPPDDTGAPPSPSPSSGPSQPRTRRRRTPAWASAIRGFSNGLGLAIFVVLVAPLATRCTNRDEVFFCAFLFAMSIAFPALGYVFTADLPDQT